MRPVTPVLSRFCLGEEYRFEDHGQGPFCALKPETRQDQFQLARAL